MSNNEAVKASLFKAPWKIAGELKVVSEGGDTVTLVIRKPPPKATTKLLKACQAEGLIDEKGEATSPDNGVAFAARMFAPMIFLPGEKEALFTAEEIADVAWFDEAAKACEAALDTRATVEAAKGN